MPKPLKSRALPSKSPKRRRRGGGRRRRNGHGIARHASSPRPIRPRARRQAKACLACHDFTKGGPNKTGPDLWDVVERPIASHEGFAYSDSLKEHAERQVDLRESQQVHLQTPRAFAPKTKMTFGGIKRDQRAPTFWPICARCRTARSRFPPHKSHQISQRFNAGEAFRRCFHLRTRNAYLRVNLVNRSATPT